MFRCEVGGSNLGATFLSRERAAGYSAAHAGKAAHLWKENQFLLRVLKGLCLKVEELEKKVSSQTEEVERLRSQLVRSARSRLETLKLTPPVLQGATDLEKQLELLLVENQRLKVELKSCKSPDAAAESCSRCSHSQVSDPPHHHCLSPGSGSLPGSSLQEAESLRREMLHWEVQARQREQQLAQLEQEVLDKSSSLRSLHQQLDETRWRQAEQQPPEAELPKHEATPPRVKVSRGPGEG